MTPAQQALLDLGKQRLRLVEAVESEQEKRERADLSFYQGEGQWDSAIRLAREGGQATGNLPPVPARPCLTITGKVREPVDHVLNVERDADLGIEIVPADDFEGLSGPIDESEIELREGLIRRIQRQHGARDARTWAFKRSTIAGRGYYGLMTRYVDGRTNDQEIYYRKFYDQSLVKLDPAHEMPDGSDAEWGFVGSYMSLALYKATYPKLADGTPNDFLDLSDGDFDELFGHDSDWYKYEGKGTDRTRMIRVVEHWYVDFASEEIVTLADGTITTRDLMPDGAALHPTEPSHANLKRTVKFVKQDGKHLLEETTWPGRFIPLIKTVGNEIPPFDAERRFEGMIRPTRDAVQGFNVMVSAEVESVGLLPRFSPELDPEQIEGYEDVWKSTNVRNWAYRPRKAFTPNGQPYPDIKYPIFDAPIQATAALVGQFDQFIKSSTGIPDPTLGNVDPSIKSGRGIRALLAQSEQGTSHYMNNLVRSEHYEAAILNDLLPAIYGRPGRIARILNAQNEPQPIILHQPFQMTNGRPQAVQGLPPGQPLPQGVKHYTLTKDAQFNIAVKVTKSFDTRRQEIEATLGEFVAADPQATLPFYADLLWKYSDVPGAQQLEERGKLMLAPAVQMAIAQQAAGQTPNPLQGLVQQLQGQLQQAQQLLQGKQMEQQGKLQIVQVQEAADNQRTQLEQQTAIQKAEIAASATMSVAQAKVDAENFRSYVDALETRLAHQLDLHMKKLDVVKDMLTGQHDSAHEAGMAALTHQHSMQQAAQAHQNTLEQGQQAAALMPPAPPDGASNAGA